jgi:hypothetical protein
MKKDQSNYTWRMKILGDEGAERHRLIRLWKRTGNEAFRQAALQLKRSSSTPDEADSVPQNPTGFQHLLKIAEPTVGRSSKPDLLPIIVMGVMLKNDPDLRVNGAAKLVAEKVLRFARSEASVDAVREEPRIVHSVLDPTFEVVDRGPVYHLKTNSGNPTP